VIARTDGAVAETPVWFGPTHRPLFGWIATPESDRGLGGLVVAPTLGRESRASRRALRRLASVASQRGFVVLRFDYEGTGDSSGSLGDPERDRAWTDNVQSAVELLRSTGVAEVSAVGMRLGATIVGGAASDRDLALRSIVLWDPCESGRTYLRELSALEALRREGSGVRAGGAIATTEFVFSQQTAEELRRFDLTASASTPLASRVLVVSRDDRAVSSKLRQRLDDEDTAWTTTTEQGQLLDVDPLFAVLPERSIHEIVDWLVDGSAEPSVVAKPHTAPTTAIVEPTDRSEVVERCVRIGEKQLFGIVCEPLERPQDAPLVVFLNVSNEDHSGPSRLWVELSRRWASRGLRCVRFDLSGLGDSPATHDQLGSSIYEQGWLDDTLTVVRELAGDPTNVVLVGLCSGAYWAIEAGIALRAKGVCVINPPVGVDFLHGVTRLGASRFALLRATAERLKQVALRLRWASVVLWKVVRVLAPSIFSVDMMRTLVDGGTNLQVLSSSEGLAPVPGHPALDRFFSRRLVVPANYEVTFVPGLDHSLHDAEGRARTVELLDHHVLDAFAPPTDGDHRTSNAEERP
jgi:alpha-beta hydrolase superfamily lysophospholipase